MRTALLFAILGLGLMATGFASTSVSFDATVRPHAASERAKMQGRSWHDGCPVSLDDLLAIRLKYLGFDGEVHDGMLVVHKRVAAEVVEIFRELYRPRFTAA